VLVLNNPPASLERRCSFTAVKRRKLNLKAKFESSSSYYSVASSAETIGAFNTTGFDTVNLHRPKVEKYDLVILSTR
jgi:hypothetical protein